MGWTHLVLGTHSGRFSSCRELKYQLLINPGGIVGLGNFQAAVNGAFLSRSQATENILGESRLFSAPQRSAQTLIVSPLPQYLWQMPLTMCLPLLIGAGEMAQWVIVLATKSDNLIWGPRIPTKRTGSCQLCPLTPTHVSWHSGCSSVDTVLN